MRLLGRNGLFYAENLAIQVRDICLQLRHAEQVERRRDQQFAGRAGEFFLRNCHKTILTDGWRGFHTPAKVDLRDARAQMCAFQAHRLVTIKGI